MDDGGVPEAGLACNRCGRGVPVAKSSWLGEEAMVDGVAAGRRRLEGEDPLPGV